MRKEMKKVQRSLTQTLRFINQKLLGEDNRYFVRQRRINRYTGQVYAVEWEIWNREENDCIVLSSTVVVGHTSIHYLINLILSAVQAYENSICEEYDY